FGIESLQENADGSISIIYQIHRRTDASPWSVVTIEQTRESDGTSRNTTDLPVECPVVRTSDGGYVYAGLENAGGTGEYTYQTHTASPVHIVKVDNGGGVLWDRTIEEADVHDILRVIRTDSGRFAVLAGAYQE
ncbi:MAG TPA: hypothetical protein VE134_09890, partial [Methanomicrobiales archaeon]|nr:hypothetical protein [Methanomicrobiales archaeon]